jgi:hypothetical protein
MYFLHIYENGTLKLVEVILRRRGGRRRIMEGINQTRVHCVHIWKCHKETPCIAIMY